jgi:hypothetical protein
MRKLKVHLFGRHSNRTPLAYEAYQVINDKFKIVESLDNAEIIMIGFVKDIADNFETLFGEQRKGKLIIVVSEEPLWDSQFSGGYLDNLRHIEKDGNTLNFVYLNHMNSSVFRYQKIPYFITTESKYITRYRITFSKYLHESFIAFTSRLESAQFKAAFIIEKRMEDYFDKGSELEEVKALSVYRSKLAESLSSDAFIQGKGWEGGKPRQALVDWHLDKISSLTGRSQIISALENTHFKLYTSEKFFDALACGAIPLTYYCKESPFFQMLNPDGLLNVYSRSIPDASELIKSFKISKSVYSGWRENINNVNHLFSDNRLIFEEKRALLDRLFTEINKYI